MSRKIRFRMGDRVATSDPRMHIRQVGYVRVRPDDERGDSVNVLAFGGRLDDLAEFIDERRDKAERLDRASINADVAEAQAANGVPVTAPIV